MLDVGRPERVDLDVRLLDVPHAAAERCEQRAIALLCAVAEDDQHRRRVRHPQELG